MMKNGHERDRGVYAALGSCMLGGERDDLLLLSEPVCGFADFRE